VRHGILVDVEAIAEAIDRRRRERRLTLTEVRDKAGLSQSQISLMANAKGTNYRSETLASVSYALGWPGDMLERIGHGQPYPEALSEDDKFDVIIQRLDQLTELMLRLVESR
jgi:DNA-binding Xre family transcriptional regulator